MLTRRRSCTHLDRSSGTYPPESIFSLIPGLHKRLQIRAQVLSTMLLFSKIVTWKSKQKVVKTKDRQTKGRQTKGRQSKAPPPPYRSSHGVLSGHPIIRIKH